MKKHLLSYWTFLILVLITIQSFGLQPQEVPPTSTPTVTKTFTITPTPTRTSTPSRTPRPTRTPNIKLTQSYEDLFSWVQKFKDEGIIPDTTGKYITLDRYTDTFAQMDWLRYDYTDVTLEHFVYAGHLEWSTTIETKKTSGCGIVFALEFRETYNRYFGVILDKSRVYFSAIDQGYYYDLGKTRGTGTLNFGNPAQADMVLLVYDHKAYVYVDDEFIGEYTLPKKKDLLGRFGFGIISGTNHGYGTRCDITNSRIWKLDK